MLLLLCLVGGAYLRDKNTCARTLTENLGGELYTKGGIYVEHYGNNIKFCNFNGAM